MVEQLTTQQQPLQLQPPLQSTGVRLRLRLRRRQVAPWIIAAATSIAFSMSISGSAAFLSGHTLGTSTITTDCGIVMQPTGFQVTDTAQARPSLIRRNVCTDPDTLLQFSIRDRQNDAGGLERLFNSSPDNEIEEPVPYRDRVRDLANKNGAEVNSEVSIPVRKKVRVTMKKSTVTTNRKNEAPKSRSSTMPGFASVTDKQKAFRDGIRMVEERTGRRFVDTPEKQRKRRKENGEAMYKNSPSVPDSMVQFADEIHQEDRITRKEEFELGEKTQEAIWLQNLYDVLEAKLAREPTDEEWCAASGKINMEAIGQAIEEGLQAKNKLVTSNLRMVQSVVNTYIRNGLSAQYNAGDLMQEGILALIRAAEKFEPNRGWAFSTYAMYWVRSSVKRSQIYQSRVIPVPQRLTENHKRLKRVEKEILVVTGKRPTRKELGEAVGMSELQVNRCYTAMEQRCYSLDQDIHNTLKPANGDSGKNSLIDIVGGENVDGDHNHFQRVMLREDLLETLNRHLSPDEVEVLLLRYGLKEGPFANLKTFKSDRQVTIAELSRMFGLKPDKVRRMIDNSLRQLKVAGMDEWLAFERDLQ